MARVQLLLLCFTILFASVTFMEHVSSATTATTTSSTTVAELEAETSKEVMEFIMKLEKKCPPKEEYKSFFEKLKATMVASAKVTQEKKKGFFSAAAGKISDAVSFIGSKFTGKSAEVKLSLKTLLCNQSLSSSYSCSCGMSIGEEIDGDLPTRGGQVTARVRSHPQENH